MKGKPKQFVCVLLIAIATTFIVFRDDLREYTNQERQNGRRLNYYSLSGYGDGLFDNHDFDDFRYLTFGTSRTWGSQLENRSLAYPWLLSPNATNLAIRASGPQIPSLCTYSMVGDAIYDVIVLEYYFFADDNLIRLARRLRHRFPNATIIFMKIWSPFQFRLRKNFSMRLTDLIAQKIRKEDYNMDEFHKIIDRYTSRDWFFMSRHQAEYTLNRAVREVKGNLLTQLFDPIHAKQYLHKFGPLFVHDTVHFSEYGHRWMRNSILTVLEKENATKSDTLNPWDGEDSCNIWFENGSPGSLIYDPKLTLNNFGPEKFALEMRGIKKTWIQIHNKMAHDAEVFIGYMTRGPDIRPYPNVEIELNGAAKKTTSTTTVGTKEKIGPIAINPNLEETAHPFPVHLVELKSLGVIPPGFYNITITEVSPNKEPFRVVGVAVTPPVEKIQWGR